MEFIHAHIERHLHVGCGHTDIDPPITNCTIIDCTRPKLIVKVICSWCIKCCECPKLWQLLGAMGSEEAIWRYWNSMSANQDESKLRRLWGPSELGEIDAAKLSFVATKTNGGAICWLEVLIHRARLLLSLQADSSI